MGPKQTNMILDKIFVALLIALCVPAAMAQSRGGGHGGGFGPGFGGAGRHPGFGRAFYYGDPYLFTDYPTDSVGSLPQPQIVFVQPAPSMPAQPEAKVEPLLIELQGDHYVRIGEASTQHENAAPRDDSSAATPQVSPLAAKVQAPARARTTPLLPATLIYRDGHSEQVRDYAIFGGIIYARGDYWQNGYWTKPIQLSALNIPATLQTNLEQGVKFVLPSGPNEVVTRP
jgi:hypothetical protein